MLFLERPVIKLTRGPAGARGRRMGLSRGRTRGGDRVQGWGPLPRDPDVGQQEARASRSRLGESAARDAGSPLFTVQEGFLPGSGASQGCPGNGGGSPGRVPQPRGRLLARIPEVRVTLETDPGSPRRSTVG